MPSTSSVHVVYSLFLFFRFLVETSVPKGCTGSCSQEKIGESHVVQELLSHLNPTTL
jgi:hypothetical protein